MSKSWDNVVVNDQIIGSMHTRPSDKVYLGIELTRARADYLLQCLERPLCQGCGREEAECDADPCTDARIERGELALCTVCTLPFDPHHLVLGKCPGCNNQLPVFEVDVFETITYTAHIEAESQEQAERVIELVDQDNWEVVTGSAQLEKYGYGVDTRQWNIAPVPRNDFIEQLDENDLLIRASNWDELTE